MSFPFESVRKKNEMESLVGQQQRPLGFAEPTGLWGGSPISTTLSLTPDYAASSLAWG